MRSAAGASDPRPEGGTRRVQVLQLGCSDDGRNHPRVVEQPRQRDLGVGDAPLLGDIADRIDDAHVALNEPLPVIAAGLAGGLAYWAIAGFSAGFWKPVFRRAEIAALRAETASHPPEIH